MKKSRYTVQGDSKLGCLFYIVIVALIIYTGYSWGKAQWNYESMKETVTDILKFTTEQREINYALTKEMIINRAAELQIALSEEDIEISENENSLTIDVYWDTPITFPGYTYYLEHHLTKTRQKRF